MSNPSISVVHHDSPMNDNIPEGPRSGSPKRRHSTTPAQKLVDLAAYNLATATSKKRGAYLREQGIYSSQTTEWRKLRDSGVLAGKQPGEKIDKLTPEQVEIARLKRKLELTAQRLATTELALEIMSKMHELLDDLASSSRDETPQTKQYKPPIGELTARSRSTRTACQSYPGHRHPRPDDTHAQGFDGAGEQAQFD